MGELIDDRTCFSSTSHPFSIFPKVAFLIDNNLEEGVMHIIDRK